jgi:5-methylcytosine-specific restriction endonuclease McrA
VKEYQRNNPEKYRSWRSKYIEANRDQIAATARTRFKEAYPRYKARRAQRHREWMQHHPEYARARVKRYRAMKLSAGRCDLTSGQWEAIKALYRYCCAYCGQPTAHLTQDHVVPLSRGGDHTAANVVPACGSCNSRKKDGPPPSTLLPLKFLSS